MTINIKNKYQCNNAIEYEPKFDSKFILSSGTKDPLSLVTVSLQGGNKQRAYIISGPTCLWDIGATSITIKILHAKPYERKMGSIKL